MTKLEKYFVKMFASDTARISRPLGNWFLIVGRNRSTRDKDYVGQWTKNGKAYHFDFVEERVIASGKTEAELIKSAKEHKRLAKGCGVFPST